jgi:hypothetical protein
MSSKVMCRLVLVAMASTAIAVKASPVQVDAVSELPAHELVDFGKGYRPMQFDTFFDCAERAVSDASQEDQADGVYPKPSVVLPIVRTKLSSKNWKLIDIEVWDDDTEGGLISREPIQHFAVLCSPSGEPVEPTNLDFDNPGLVMPRTRTYIAGVDDDMWGYSFSDVNLCSKDEARLGRSTSCVSGIVFATRPSTDNGTGNRSRYPSPCKDYEFLTGALHANPSIFDKIKTKDAARRSIKSGGLVHLTWKDNDGEVIVESKNDRPKCNKDEQSATFRTQCANFIREAYESAKSFAVADIANEKVSFAIQKFPEKISGGRTWQTDFLGSKAGSLVQRAGGVAIDKANRAVLFNLGNEFGTKPVSRADVEKALKKAKENGEFEQYENEMLNIENGRKFWAFSIKALKTAFPLPLLTTLDEFVKKVIDRGNWWQHKELRQSKARVVAYLYGCAWVHEEVGGFQFR